MLADRWKEWDGKICGDNLTTEAFVNLTYLALKGVEYEISEIEAVLYEMRNRATTFVDQHEGSSTRERRWIKPALGGVAAAIVLAPILKEGFCHYFSFFGLCDGDSNLDELGNEASFLDGAVRTIVLETGERLHLLGHSLNKTQTQLKMISHDSNENFELFRGLLRHVLGGTDDQRKEKSACKMYKWNSLYSQALKYSTVIANHSATFDTIRAELIAFKMAVHNYGYILDDALSSLTRGYIPATLVPPEVLTSILDGIQLDKTQEAIPRTELMTYYGFELVQSTVITGTGINVLINIPVHHTMGLHDVYRATPLPQPANGGSTATQYKFVNTHLLVSERRDNFAEIPGEVISAHCSGSNRLKLCFRPFAMSRSSESSCLASLFFDLPTNALKLCPQEVIVLPEIPTATYLDDSTYLVMSRDDDYTLFNYSRGAKDRGEPIAGCRSCLLRPSCDGRIETPDGALVLVPDPRTCQYETGLTIMIRQHPLIQSLFATLEEAEKNLPGVMIPEILKEQARSEMVEALRLNLVKLPEGSVDEETISEITKPFADEILHRYTPFHWQMLRNGPVQLGVVVWLLVTVFVILVCVYWRCFSRKVRLLRVNMRRRRGEEFEDSYCCVPPARARGVPPPRYDPQFERGLPRPNSYPQGPSSGDVLSGQIFLPPRVPEGPSFEDVNLSRVTDMNDTTSTPLMGRGINYMRGKWRGTSKRGPRVGTSAIIDTTL